jgi:hypothetical protein
VVCCDRRFAGLAVAVALGSACAPAAIDRVSIRALAEPIPVTFTAATNSAPPGAILSISGRCGVDNGFGHGFADISLSPYDYLANNSVQWEMDASGNFRGGFLIAPNTARGASTFDVFCYGAGMHAAAADLRGIPFTVAGATVHDFSIEAQPASGGPGTHVTLHGTGCILDGTPLDEAHVTIDFLNDRQIRVDLVAPVGPDGNWTTTFTVPENIIHKGPALFQATCEAPATHIGHFDSSAIFTVDSIPPPTSTTSTTSTTTTTTTTTTPTCHQSPGGVVSRSFPTTVTVTDADAFTAFDVPVGSGFNVQLRDDPSLCWFSPFRAPEWGPSGVIRGANGSDVVVGNEFDASFVVVGPGDGEISVSASCGPLPPTSAAPERYGKSSSTQRVSHRHAKSHEPIERVRVGQRRTADPDLVTGARRCGTKQFVRG